MDIKRMRLGGCVWLVVVVITMVAAGKKFSISSRNFASGRYIPAKHATLKVPGGKNISPALNWSNPPAGTKSFVITCVDTNPIAKRWVHWMVVNIPRDSRGIPEGASLSKMPKGAVELANSFGDDGWGGPQPPRGSGLHRYVFSIYALNISTLPVRQGDSLSERQLLALLKGHVLGRAVLFGLFQR